MCIVLAVLIISAWTLKAHEMTGRWVLINDANSMNFFLGKNPYTPLYKTWWFGSHGNGEPDIPDEFVRLFGTIRNNPPGTADRLYTQIAVEHILTRPGLFVIRTANRIRSYFAFDTFTGSFLITHYSMGKPLGLAIIAIDAFFYCSIMVAAICLLFYPGTAHGPRDALFVALGIGLVYAIPYWISFSHPTYHLPVVPLLAAAATLSARHPVDPPRDNLAHGAGAPRKGKLTAFLALTLLFYIQVEWILVMRSRV